MTRQDALEKIKELEKYISDLDKPIGFEDDNIFLLSIEEYERYKDKIPYINTWWWLRSPGLDSFNAAYVYNGGSVDACGNDVYDEYGAVRPALKYANLKSEIIKSKEENCFIWNEIKWKIIDEENKIAITYLPITFDKFDYKSNDYESSYIRRWLLNWYEEGKQ